MSLMISVLRNGFTLLSIDAAIQNVILGLAMILALLMDALREQMEAKRRRLAAAKSVAVSTAPKLRPSGGNA